MFCLPRHLLPARAAGLVLGVLLLAPLSVQAQYFPPASLPGRYLGNNIYVRSGIDSTQYYYWTRVPGTVPVLIRTVALGQQLTTPLPGLPLVPGLPGTTTVQTTTQTTTQVIQQTPVYPFMSLNPALYPVRRPVPLRPLYPLPVPPRRFLR